MFRFFDTCQVIDYCVPSSESEPEPEPEPIENEWMIPPSVVKNRSWRPWSRRARSTVRAVPVVYPEHLAQEMKRDT
jgi:hypothetical protein